MSIYTSIIHLILSFKNCVEKYKIYCSGVGDVYRSKYFLQKLLQKYIFFFSVDMTSMRFHTVLFLEGGGYELINNNPYLVRVLGRPKLKLMPLRFQNPKKVQTFKNERVNNKNKR